MATLGAPSHNTVVLQDPWRRCWTRYRDPVRVIQAGCAADVMPLLEAVQTAVETEELTAAGFVAYEAAPACDAALATHSAEDFPLAWFGLYAQSERIEPPAAAESMAGASDWTPSLTDEAYHAAIARVRNYIAAGATYQVNFSFRLRAAAPSDPWALFSRMAAGAPSGYAAYIDSGDWMLCSASPELFFRLCGRDIVSRPMKGTRPRGRWPDEDVASARELQTSAKDRAENVMIVDMVRNDLGRIADAGSVEVVKLFDVERYPTVLQMTSTVHGLTDAGLPGIFRALFPAASITGAPKAHTMALIKKLEDAPRRIYTGAIGYLAPGRDAQFNVAIRTALVDRRRNEAEYGVGGGIVWDSTEQAELTECYTKAAVVRRPAPPFDLLESLLWMPGTGCFLLEPHLARLEASADYFGRPIDMAHVRDALRTAVECLAQAPHKVRMTVNAAGEASVSAAPLRELARPYRVGVASEPVDTQNCFLFHKTTHRAMYDQARRACPAVDDVLLWNAEGELTESTSANLIVEWDGKLVTPPVRCGLLAGVHRGFLLTSGTVSEAVLHRDDLVHDTRIYLANSVRGMWEVEVAT